MRTLSRIPIVVLCVVTPLLCGCGVVDPERPTPQPDTTVFGNLLEVSDQVGDEPRLVKLRVSIPKALGEAGEIEGRPTPTVEKGTAADVTVGLDTVVLLAGSPVSLDDFNPGTEMVVVPLPGSTRMVGSAKVLLEAAYLTDFETYRGWQLPGLDDEPAEDAPEAAGDADRVNGPGIEHAPIPLDGGRVLYFASRLRSPARPDGQWYGARRGDLATPSGETAPVERPFRTVLTGDGWARPEQVRLPGVEDALSVQVTWIDEGETACLVSVADDSGVPWVGRSQRASAGVPWSAVERIGQLGTEDARDGVYLAGSSTKVAFVSSRGTTASADLFLLDPAAGEFPLPLDPRINTQGDEWSPRVGPDNELYFCRGDRQMVYSRGEVRAIRLPIPHRVIITEAAATRDGTWLFFCLPKLTPVELDQDIYAARIEADGSLGSAQPIDDWRPE